MPIPIKSRADAFAGSGGTVVDSDLEVAAMGNGTFVFNRIRVDGAERFTGVQLYRASGTNINGFGFTGADQFDPSSDGFSSGDSFVIAAARGTGGGPNRIWASVESNSLEGLRSVTPLTPISPAGTDDHEQPEVVTLDDATFATAWVNTTQDSIQLVVFRIDGQQISIVQTVSNVAVTGHDNVNLGLTRLSNGSIAVSWFQGAAAVFRIYTEFGNPETPVLDVAPGGAEVETSIEALADGRFVIVYYAGGAVMGRIFENNGVASAAAFTILPAGGNIAEYPQVTALQDGRFMVVAERGEAVVARVMRADGSPDGAEFQVNTVGTGTIGPRPAIDTLADGRVVVGWVTEELGVADIKYAIYDPREATVYLTGTGVADDLIGTSFPDQLAGGRGDDILVGGGGGDQLTGGAGLDTLNGDDGNDFILGEGDADTMNGGNGQDTMYGGVGRDVMRGDADNDYMVGQAGGDDIRGGSGNEVIIGDEEGGAGDGFDYIEGGVGDDLIFGCGGNDQIIGDNAGGTGVGNDTLYGMDGNDTIFAGLGADVVYGGSGDDFLFGNEDGDYIVGELGNDTIDGGAGNDILLGDNEGGSGTGNDTINGGAGNDQIYLGAGGDAVRFDQAGAANADQVFNFTSGNDKIALAYGAFGAADQGAFVVRFVGGPGAVANTAGATILYDTNTGSLLYDADGNGAGAAVIIATFSSVPTLAAGDLVFY